MDIAMPAHLMRLWTARTRTMCFLAVAVPFIVSARTIVVPPPAMPEHADTEVSTNMAVRVSDEQTQEIEMCFTLQGTSVSNCIQVAFGRDADGDGIVGADEANCNSKSGYGRRKP